MQDVFKNEDNFIAIGNEWMSKLKDAAKQSPKMLSRLCMHTKQEDIVQEMVLAFTRECLIPPNSSIGKSESLAVIEGEMLLVLFSDDGQVIDRIKMGPVGGEYPYMYRFCSASWHTMIPLTDFVVVNEYIQGPFVKSDVATPEWVPQEKQDLEVFLKKIVSES